MTIKVLGKEFNATKENAKEVSRKLTDMLFDSIEEKESLEITGAMVELYEAFGV